jgi:hypothetical protein
MRPDLGDVVSGVQRLLQTEIVPTLRDEYAQGQATYALILLEYVKSTWSRQHLAVAEEHGDLAATLTAVAGALDGLAEPETAALAAEARAALAGHVAPVSATPLDAVLEVDRARRDILERCVRLLDALAPASLETGAGATARSAVDAYLVRAAARQEAALKVLGLIW